MERIEKLQKWKTLASSRSDHSIVIRFEVEQLYSEITNTRAQGTCGLVQ